MSLPVQTKPSQRKRKARRQSGYLRSHDKEKKEEKQKARERYIQLNAEFQRIARKHKKPFFNEQCLIIEENNKWGKTRDLFGKLGNIKGAFPKMGTIKDKDGRDLVDAEEIKKRWKEYTEELY